MKHNIEKPSDRTNVDVIKLNYVQYKFPFCKSLVDLKNMMYNGLDSIHLPDFPWTDMDTNPQNYNMEWSFGGSVEVYTLNIDLYLS